MARYVVIRGLLLIVLELTVIRVGIWLTLDPAFLGMLQVIWVLGVSMIVLAGLLFLPRIAVLVVAVVMIVGHDALDRGRRRAASTGSGRSSTPPAACGCSTPRSRT